MSAPRAPTGLGAAGRKLWREVLADYELSPDGLSLLTAAARTLDELDRLHEAIAAGEVMTTAHPVSRSPTRYTPRPARTGRRWASCWRSWRCPTRRTCRS